MRIDIAELDDKGIWLRDVSLFPVNIDDENNPIYNYPEFYTTTKPPTKTTPFYRPRWTGSEWIEDMPQSEIDELNKPKPKPPTLEEQLADKDRQIIELMKMQNVTDSTVSEISATLQELIELTLEMGNV